MRERGFWAPPFEAILQADPDFLQAYLDFSASPWRTGPLEPKVKELVYIAADASVTHLHQAGTRSHVRSALGHGATPQEVVSVLQLVSLLGLQSLELGVRVLLEETGHESPEDEDHLDALARLDPTGSAAARGWVDAVHRLSPLEPKVVELLGVAVNASTTHLNEAATARHVRAALQAGATVPEVVEVLELVSVLGIHTATMAMPILFEDQQGPA